MKKRPETEKEFRAEVERRMKRKIPEDVWVKCIPYESHAPFGPEDINEVIANLEDAGIHSQPQNQLGIELIRSKFAAKSVEPDVRKIREELFGDYNPPFKDLTSMSEWIYAENAQQPKPTGHAPRFGYYFDFSKIPNDEFIKKLEQLQQDKPGNHGKEYARLAIPHENGFTSFVVVSEKSPLRHLWLAVRNIAKKLDCEEAQATGFILTGKIPIQYALTGAVFGPLEKVRKRNGKIILTISEPISDRDVSRLYKKLRYQLWGKRRSPRKSEERDFLLVDFIDERINPEKPEWENLRRDWNQQFPEHRFNYWRDFRKAYKRAMDKAYPSIDPKGVLRG